MILKMNAREVKEVFDEVYNVESTVISACGRSRRDGRVRGWRDALARALEAGQAIATMSPEEVAADEFYWREIQMDFKLDRTIINLNNGFTCPTPRVALEAEWRYMDMINMAPIFYQGPIAERIQTIRLRMAA